MTDLAARLGDRPQRGDAAVALPGDRGVLAGGGHLPVGAHAAGYRSDSAFRRAFKEHFGIAPSVYAQRFATAR